MTVLRGFNAPRMNTSNEPASDSGDINFRSGPKVSRVVRCIIYTRVSTDEQAKQEHYSLDAQEAYCLEEIKKRQNEGWIYLRTISDPGYSGFKWDRPGLIELVTLVKAKKVDVIVVYKRERLFRNLELSTKAQTIFESHGVRVLSFTEGMHDNSPHSVLMRQWLDANAQFERASGRKRSTDCLRFAAKRGHWKGGTAPYGYNYTAGSKVLSLNTIEAPVVKLIFERVSCGTPINQVLQELRTIKAYGRPRNTRPGRNRDS